MRATSNRLGNNISRMRTARSPGRNDHSKEVLKVMFVTTSLEVGGAASLLSHLVRRLDRERFSPELCCLRSPGAWGTAISEEIPTFAGLLKHKYQFQGWQRLARLFREREPQIVATLGGGDEILLSRLSARTAGVPLTVAVLPTTAGKQRWVRLFTPLADAYVAAAETHAQRLVQTYRLPASKVHHVPGGVDLKKFYPRPAVAQGHLHREHDIPSDAHLLGIVGALQPEKNHEMFLRVATMVRIHVPRSHFFIVGDGPERARLEDTAARWGIRDAVHFLGNRPDVPDLLAELDVVLCTSNHEANPVSVWEAMASGKPIVATRAGYLPETIRDGESGFLVIPGQAEKMCQYALQILRDPLLGRKLGNNARHWAEKHVDVERMVAGYERLFKDLHAQKQGQPNLVIPQSSEAPWSAEPAWNAEPVAVGDEQ